MARKNNFFDLGIGRRHLFRMTGFLSCAVAVLHGCSSTSTLNLNYNYSRRLWESDLFRGYEDYRKGDYGSAEKLFRRAVSEAESFGPNNHRLAISLTYLARCLQHDNKFASAAADLERARQIWSKLLQGGSKGSTNKSTAEELAQTLTDLAVIYLLTGNIDKAAQCSNQAITLYQPMWEADKSKIDGQFYSKALVISGHLQQRNGDSKRAAELFRQALEINGTASTLEQRARWLSMLQRAQTDIGTAKYGNAKQDYLMALKEVDKPGANPICIAEPLHGLARLCKATADYANAEIYYRRLVELLSSALGPDDPYLADPLYHLGTVYQTLNEPTDALRCYERAVAIWERSDYSKDPGGAIVCMEAAAEMLTHLQEHEKAQDMMAKAVKLNERCAPQFEDYARLLRRQGRDAEANQVMANIERVRKWAHK